MNGLLKNNGLLILLISLVAGLVFIPFIGNCPLFDWDEINFAECAREMLVSGDYSHVQLHYRPFWEKPPFFIWLQAISMNIFGVNEFAARFPNAVCSIVSLITIFIAGKTYHSPRFGLTWALLYIATLLPHFYFRSGIIDPWFNLFIFLSVYNCVLFINNIHGKKELRNALFAGFFLGMAVLTKGPAALLIVGIAVIFFLFLTKKMRLVRSRYFVLFGLSALLVSCSWFVIELLKGNSDIIAGFIDYQVRLYKTEDSGHGGPIYYHFIVLLLGCFPSSVLFIAAYSKTSELAPFQLLFRRMMLCLFWVVLILFSIVKTKIIHYSSACYFPLTLVAANALVNNRQYVPGKLSKALFWFCASVLALFFTLIGLTPWLKESLISSGLIEDKFVIANLRAEVKWSGFEWLLGVLLLAASFILYQGFTRQRAQLSYLGLALNVLFIFLSVLSIVPKIEQYTQRAAIEFIRSCAGRDVHVETHGYKSYAHLFYAERRPEHFSDPEQVKYIEMQLDEMEKEGRSRLASYSFSNMLWMEHGKINKPAFIVVKITSEHELLANKRFSKLYEQNGYAFFVRLPD